MPDNETWFQKETSINFTVKNLTNRAIKVFNYKIGPGNSRDLLAIPEISEADIRHSLIKGELVNFIRMGVITVVSSSIDLTQYDQQQQEFLNNAGVPDNEAIGTILFGNEHTTAATIFDGTNTFSFATLSSTTYTLTKDVFLVSNSILNAGITLFTAGYRFFCNGTFINNGTIHCDGYSAILNIAGAHSAVGTLGIGLAGGNGHVGVGIGTGPSPQSNALGDANAFGGNGGAGGAQNGGTGGAYLSNGTNAGSHMISSLETGVLYLQQGAGTGVSLVLIGGGAGGAGGGSDNAGVTGGGGGGGGGVLIMNIFDLINNGAIHARGGNGADASGSGGNGGGGGGGGGGLINLLNRFYSGTGTIDTNAGSGGAGLGSSGNPGLPGGVGHINHFPM